MNYDENQFVMWYIIYNLSFLSQVTNVVISEDVWHCHISYSKKLLKLHDFVLFVTYEVDPMRD